MQLGSSLVYDGPQQQHTIAHGGMANGLGMKDGRGAREPGHYSRPAEKYSSFVLVASDINIFGTLPNWQGKLFVRPPNNQPEQARAEAPRVWELFLVSSGPLVHSLAALASRRCCVEDDTDCSSRSWSVSIQTVVVVPKASSVLPCPGKGGWMAMHEEALKDDWSDSSNETRLPWIFPGTLFRSGTGDLSLHYSDQ